MSTITVDPTVLRDRVREMYRAVARQPDGEYHFETGRDLAERLGYPVEWLDAVPEAALACFAGVGYLHDLARISHGDAVVDLGCGSGTDAFIAAKLTGPDGQVVGLDMTDAPLMTARAARDDIGLGHLAFLNGLFEDPPVEPGGADVVISNGAINLAPDKERVFRAAARALLPGGRLAIADLVAERALTKPRQNVALWAACVAGAEPQEAYLRAIEAAGLRVQSVRSNPAYRFLSPRAQAAAAKYGVTSLTILATKENR